MKGCLKSLVVVLLIVLVVSFFVFRGGFIDDAAAYFEGALARFNRLTELFSPSEEPQGDEPGGAPGGPVDTGGNYGDYKPSEVVDATLEATLRAGLTNMEREIDLSALSPTKDAVKNAMSAIIYASPEYFYLQSSYSMSTSGDTVLSLSPTYSATSREVADMRTVYEQKLAEIVAGAPQDGSDFDKLLYLHDYFVTNYSYDHTLTVRDAYTFFTGKTGVCQAYMLGLIATARELGIESIPVTSDVMKHAWNLVKIDGAWYHVDLTWDDARSHPTLISYTYFLQSDAGLTAIDATKKEADRHRAWVSAKAATDTKYDTAAFHSANTAIIKHGDVYYLSVRVENNTPTVHGKILSGTDITAMTYFADIKGGYWVAGGNNYYNDCYAGLAMENGYLYYNSGNSIGRVSLADPTSHRQYVINELGAGESIYGITGVENGTVTYLKATAPDALSYTVGNCNTAP